MVSTKSIGKHWIHLYASNNSVTYFDSFGVDSILEEKIVIGNKNIIRNIFRINTYDSIRGNLCIGVNGFLINGKSLKYFTNLFLLHNFIKNNKGFLVNF